tara:strand:- start:9166 stop:9873 length:708 start_codon:yes stop_codon:yes gene_type:complete
MIKFFRKIRQNLIKENKISKYLMYALGEIILVIIGILFALQINNWNEENKTEQELQSSMVSMIEELNENINFLNKEKESFQLRLERTTKLIENKATDKDLKEIIEYIGQDVNSRPFKKVFELIKENKQLQLIENKELIKSINNFYEYILPDIDKLSTWHDGFVSDNIDPYILENIPLEKGLVDPKITRQLLTQIKFKNILTYQSIIYESFVRATTYTIEQAEELSIQITSYLKTQ